MKKSGRFWVTAILVVAAMVLFLQGRQRSVPDNYKRHMCSEAERGAFIRCTYLGVAKSTCDDIAANAFRLCYESLPEKYAR